MGEHCDTQVYRCSDGGYYTDVQVWKRLESREWTVCCWDADSMEEWVRTGRDELLYLQPISTGELPAEISLRTTDAGTVTEVS